jgi:hypothetical protein
MEKKMKTNKAKEKAKMKLSNKQIDFIIKAVRDWEKQHIDYIELRYKLERCIKWCGGDALSTED